MALALAVLSGTVAAPDPDYCSDLNKGMLFLYSSIHNACTHVHTHTHTHTYTHTYTHTHTHTYTYTHYTHHTSLYILLRVCSHTNPYIPHSQARGQSRGLQSSAGV